MAVFWTDSINITPGTTDSWVDIDVSSYIKSGSTGVLLRIELLHNSSYGIRKNGSTDNRLKNTIAAGLCWAAIGIDENGILEIYNTASSGYTFWLVGFFDSGATFFTNSVEKTVTASGVITPVFYDIDISGDTGEDTAIAAIFELDGYTTWCLRKNGSTDNRVGAGGQAGDQFACIIGVDGSEICE